MLLFSSYVVHAGVAPLLPELTIDLRVADLWKGPLVSIWMIVRLGTFALMQRWHDWHGRWATPALAAAALLLGAGLCVTAGSVAALAAGLCLLGLGVGAVYAAALDATLSAGISEIDAGGRHEAMIGLGYAVGPLAALVIGRGTGLLH